MMTLYANDKLGESVRTFMAKSGRQNQVYACVLFPDDRDEYVQLYTSAHNIAFMRTHSFSRESKHSLVHLAPRVFQK